VLHPAGGRPISTRALAARVKAQGGSISPTYISELRTGKRSNPTMEHIVGLAAAFGVPAGYFTDPEVAARVDKELDRLEQFKQKPELAELAEQTVAVNMRTASLDNDDREQLADMVKAFWKRRRHGQDT